MTDQKVLLGFSVPKGEPVFLKLHHLGIFGMTQLSGKTTTLLAILSRSRLQALTFRTKRGELEFEGARRLPIYFDERGLADWRALEGLLAATLEEKVQREPGVRAAVIRVCQDLQRKANPLMEVLERIEEKLENPKIRSFDKDVYTKLQAYLQIVVPQLQRIHYSNMLQLHPNLNVMDLEGLSDEVQALVIASTVDWVYRNAKNTVLVLPEVWKFIPQDRGSPCKPAIEKLMREGAIVGNYVFLDSQDQRAVDKKFLRQMDNWILGRQRESHEIESLLKQIPLPKKGKPSPEQIQTLRLGFFYAVLGNEIHHVYVLPAGVPEAEGRLVAQGKVTPETVRDKYLEREVPEAIEGRPAELGVPSSSEIKILQDQINDLKTTFDRSQQTASELPEIKDTVASLAQKVEAVNQRLTTQRPEVQQAKDIRMPSRTTLNLEDRELIINLSHREETVNMTTRTVEGKVLLSALELSKEGFSLADLKATLLDRGWNIGDNTLNPTVGSLAKQGLLIRLQEKGKYRLPTRLKIQSRVEEP